MNSSCSVRLIMAPLAVCLSLAAAGVVSAAPSKKKAAPAPAPAPLVVEAPAPEAKKPLLQRLNPFRKKSAPPAGENPVPPAPAAVKNSKKKSAATVPARSLAEAETLKPGALPAKPAPLPPAPPSKARTKGSPAPVAQAPAPVEEPAVESKPKKAGFFARLRSRLDEDRDAPQAAEKPERPADWKERWVVSEDSTAFFEFGPSQASGPDLRLSKGQVVKLTEAGRGWARVELEGGRQGYIGTDQMRQAAESDFSDILLPAAGTQLAATGAMPKGWVPAAPLPDLPDVPMAPGTENSSLLLPPLEFEGTELKKSSLKLPGTEPPLLEPGDALPAPSAPAPAPEPAAAEEKPAEAKPLPVPAPPPAVPAPAEKPAEAAPAPAPAPEPEKEESAPAPAPGTPA